MASTDPRVDAYIGKSAPFARPILTHIRKAVHAGCPDVEETMKWSAPHFVYKGMLCGMASFKAHCAFGFWKASLLKTSGGTKSDEAMGQFGRIASVDDLPGSKQLAALVRQAAALNDQGVKVPRRKKAALKLPPTAPADFMKALRANKKALAAFTAFSPSHKREYIEWISEAKTVETRQRRMATALEWLSDGKARNWKYQKQG